MGELIFVIGGAGSGKSRFALGLADKAGGPVTFVATCGGTDKEMERKIRNHRKERPSHWETVEAAETPFSLNGSNGRIRHSRESGNPARSGCLLVDSLTLWVSALVLKDSSPERIAAECGAFLEKTRRHYKKTVIVSDEVGFGVVPDNAVARNFREILGSVNQQVSESADEVYLVAAGLPIQLKGKNAR